MINSFISLHSYLIVNGALAIGYIIARTLLCLPYFQQHMSQRQRLKYARCYFFVVIFTFLLLPDLMAKLPLNYHSNFQLEPILRSASSNFLEQHKSVSDGMNIIRSQQSSFSFYTFFRMILLIGVGLFLVKYIKNLLTLFKFYKDSYCQHKIRKIHILFSNKAESPFCWSFLQYHFVVIPQSMLEKNTDMKLALQHELQHIRQGDTHWLHLLSLIHCFCFWNPFIKLWINLFDELHEFACDESILTRKQLSPFDYAECLINVAADTLNNKITPQGALGIRGLSKSILFRRVNMLFIYKKSNMKKLSIAAVYIISFFTALSLAFAFNGTTTKVPLSIHQVVALIKQSHLDKSFQISATPEVVNEMNNILSSEQARNFMRDSLRRMKNYQPTIQQALKQKSMPNDLLVIPLVESGYQPLDQSKNRVLAAGIWQIIPDTAKRFGLVINKERDDRLDTNLATNAALRYLSANYEQFHDWKLASIAYEIGENNTKRLIKTTGSRDAWTLARSYSSPSSLKKFLAMFDAAVIIMHNPSLIS